MNKKVGIYVIKDANNEEGGRKVRDGSDFVFFVTIGHIGHNQ